MLEKSELELICSKIIKNVRAENEGNRDKKFEKIANEVKNNQCSPEQFVTQMLCAVEDDIYDNLPKIITETIFSFEDTL